MLINFFGICKESMLSVANLKNQKWYEDGDTVPVTWRSQQLVPLSSSWIGPKLTNEDESYVDMLLWPVYTTHFGGFVWSVYLI